MAGVLMTKCNDLGKGVDVSEHGRAAVVRQDCITWKSEEYAGRQSSVGEGSSQIGLGFQNCSEAVVFSTLSIRQKSVVPECEKVQPVYRHGISCDWRGLPG